MLKKIPNETISSTLHLRSVPAPCKVVSPTVVSFPGRGAGVTPQSSCLHSAGSVSHQLS